MARIETWYRQDMDSPVVVHCLTGSIFTADEYGNLFGIELYKDGSPYSGSGTVSANVIRADGTTVAVTGIRELHRCYAVMPQAAYAVPGTATIVLKLADGSDITTIGAFVVAVTASHVGSIVNPGVAYPLVAIREGTVESGTESGSKGEIKFDTSYLYLCVSDNTWKKIALSSV